MARSLDQIIQELDAGYSPGRRLINERIAALPAQADAEISGLKAQEQDYFDNTIMSGARARGLGFSGIPEGERARYGATQFLPAIARVRGAQNEARTSLLGALNDVNLDQRKTAMSVYQTELDREEAARQAAASRAAASKAFSLPGFGGGTSAGAQAPDQLSVVKQKAMADVQAMLGRRDTRSFYEELMAIQKSAGYGNQYDQAKLELLAATQPGLFINGRLNEDRVRSLGARAR